MSRIRLTTLALAAIAVCSGVLTASLLVPPADVTPIVVDNGAGSTGSELAAGSATAAGSGTARAAVSFGVTDAPGHAMSLRPGTTGRQWVRLTNPNDVPIEVSALSAVVGQPVDRSGRPLAGCSANAITVAPLPTPVSVPPHGHADTTLSVHMAPNTPTDCQGANYPLSYTGSGKPTLPDDHPSQTGTPSTTRTPDPTSTSPAPGDGHRPSTTSGAAGTH
jgi:hypothetical protein